MSCSHAASTSSQRSSSGTAAATHSARAATSRVWSQRSLRPASRRRASSDGSPAPPGARPPPFSCTSRNGTPGSNRLSSDRPKPDESGSVHLCAQRWTVAPRAGSGRCTGSADRIRAGDLWIMSRALGVSALRTSARYTRADLRTPFSYGLTSSLANPAESVRSGHKSGHRSTVRGAIRLLGDPPAEREDTRRFSRR